MSLFMFQSKLQSDAMTSWSQHQKCKRSSIISMSHSWCHEILVTAPGMQEEFLYKFILIFMSVFQSSTELAHAGYIYVFVYFSLCCVL